MHTAARFSHIESFMCALSARSRTPSDWNGNFDCSLRRSVVVHDIQPKLNEKNPTHIRHATVLATTKKLSDTSR